MWKKISDDGRDLVNKLLTVDPVKRLSAGEAETHRWITSQDLSEEHIADAHAVIRSRYLERRNKTKAR